MEVEPKKKRGRPKKAAAQGPPPPAVSSAAPRKTAVQAGCSSSSHLLVSLARCAGARGSTCAVVVRTFWALLACPFFFFWRAHARAAQPRAATSYVPLCHRAFVFVLTHVSLLAPAKMKQPEEEPVAKRSDNGKGKSEEEEGERLLLEGPSVVPTAEDEMNGSSSEMVTIKKMLTQLVSKVDNMEKKIANIPLMVKQEMRANVPGGNEAEIKLPPWFSSKDFYSNGHELGFWTPSGVKFSSKDSDVFYRKIIVVMLESELLTDADKVPFMNDMEELDDEKLDEFLKHVKKWDAKQPKSLHDYLKAARTKRTTELVSIGGKDIAHSRYYNILLTDAMMDEEQRELNNKMIASKRHNNVKSLSDQGYKELFVYCSKMGPQFKLNFDEWKEMMALSPENPRPQQVTFESHSKAMRESTSYKEWCGKLGIHEVENEKVELDS
jgi:hypothetical protein